MKLSELKEGVPIKVQAFKDEKKVAEIWGKVHKTLKNESWIEVYYYEGANINLNSPDYEIQAVGYTGGKEQPIEMRKARVRDMDENIERLKEKRDSFRIYISVIVDCVIKNVRTSAVLVDLSEGGFRIGLRGYAFGRDVPVVLYVEDEEFNFKLSGKIVWANQSNEKEFFYGCKLSDDQDKQIVKKYIHKKQLIMLKKLQDEIKKELQS